MFLFAIIILADLGFLRAPLRRLHLIPYGDKIGHFALAGILSYLLTASLIQALPSRDSQWIAVAVGILLAFVFTVDFQV